MTNKPNNPTAFMHRSVTDEIGSLAVRSMKAEQSRPNHSPHPLNATQPKDENHD